MKVIKQTIFGKKYRLLVAQNAKQKKQGMNIFLSSPKNTGMLFPYKEEITGRSFTLSQTPFNLRVIFLNKYNQIVHQEIGFAYQKSDIVCKKPSMTVIEIPV